MAYLSDYCEHSMAVCESPELFHIWTGLWAMSSVIGRNLYVLSQGKQVYPNFFVILVGPSARVQKSTVADIGCDAVTTVPTIEVFKDRMTRSYLTTYFNEVSQATGESIITIYVREMATAFNKMTIEEGIMSMLTSLYDCPPDHAYYTQSRKKEVLLRPCANLLMCSTPTWLKEGLAYDQMGGGFSGRVIFVFGEEAYCRRPYSRHAPEGAVAAQERVFKRLARIAQMKGEMVMEPAAYAMWDAFRQSQDARRKEVDVRLVTYFDRKHAHILKLSMLMALGQHGGMTITADDVERAMLLLQDTEPSMLQALRGVGLTRMSVESDIITETLERAGGKMKKSALVRELVRKQQAISKRALEDLLQTLVEARLVAMSPVQVEAGKRADTWLELRRETP